MVGKGSVSHNSRIFHAANTDPERSHLNLSYCNESIEQVYHGLFDEALVRHNEKQTRNDRVIPDYYEKIRSGKQEKPFHEIILQIGNCDDMNAKTENGELAKTVLDEYMRFFQRRNPNLRVFSAHLHMDEATPHLHIDFVPFITESKRGLDTRVSLKQALAAQGYKGGTRQDTEWNQWVSSEKSQLAVVMERHGIEWLKLGTHEKHLSVLNYEKKMRSEEVEQLENKIDSLQDTTQDAQRQVNDIQARIDHLQSREYLINLNVDKYDTAPEWQLPEPNKLMSANAYKSRTIEPFVKKLKSVIRSLVSQYLELKSTVSDLSGRLSRAYADNERLMDRITEVEKDNTKLVKTAKDYLLIQSVFGKAKIYDVLSRAKTDEQIQKLSRQSKSHEKRR